MIHDWTSECISQRAPYFAHDRNNNPEYLDDLMRLRLGSHWLSVVTGRSTDGGTARPHRYCRKCTSYKVEDEKHFMMECPGYEEIREDFKEFYDDCEGDMRELMCH